MKGPGTCADCGNDAYIRLADDEMVCAYCFAARARGTGDATRPTDAPPREQPPRHA